MVDPVTTSAPPAPPAAANPSALGLGTVLGGRYEIVRFIARGGMAEVFEARDRTLGRAVAVKVFRAAGAVDRARFDAEITTLAGLDHPGLVTVYDAGDHRGDGYVVLQLVEGPTLRATLDERGALPEPEARDLGVALAGALAYVHQAGVVHRDVTPANVLFGLDGCPRLADFGIARLIDTSRVTAASTTLGTAAYMAPEQVQGQDVTTAADVYALGLVLIEALSGQRPFPGPSHEAALARLVKDPVIPAEVPPRWHDLLTAMTARAPEDRPPASTVAARLGELAPGSPAHVPAPATVLPAAAPIVVPSPDAGAADPGSSTTVLPAVAGPPPGASGTVGDGTAVMPVAMAPSVPPTDRSRPLLSGRSRWILVAAAALLALLALERSGGGWDDALARARADGTVGSTVPVDVGPVATTVTTVPTTVTTAPPDDAKGKGNDKGKHKGEDDEDDD